MSDLGGNALFASAWDQLPDGRKVQVKALESLLTKSGILVDDDRAAIRLPFCGLAVNTTDCVIR